MNLKRNIITLIVKQSQNNHKEINLSYCFVTRFTKVQV